MLCLKRKAHKHHSGQMALENGECCRSGEMVMDKVRKGTTERAEERREVV